MNNKKVVYGIGLPRCGKKTHLWRIAREQSAPYIDVGATLRAIKEVLKKLPRMQEGVDYPFAELFIANHRHSGIDDDLLKPLVNGGHVDRSLIMSLLSSWVEKNRSSELAIIDGAPRDLEQAKILRRLLKTYRFKRHSVWFSTPPEVCFNRPSREGREDDSDPETFQKRVDDFVMNTLPMKRFLQSTTFFLEVDNSHRSIEHVRGEICQFLGLSQTQARSNFPVGISISTAQPA